MTAFGSAPAIHPTNEPADTILGLTSEQFAYVLKYASPEERAELDRLLRPGGINWEPLPGPQSLAYESDADELFYGGAAGGGKTDLELGLAFTRHWRSVVFRREIEQLRGIIDRSHEIADAVGKFNENTKRWRLKSGRMVEFGGVQREEHVKSWQGQPHDLICFDELPNFTGTQYRFLIGWNRTSRVGQRCRVVGVGNPPTDSDGEWVIERWAPWLDDQYPRPARPGELRWFAVIDGKDVEVESGAEFAHGSETIIPKSRTFVPARVMDNPYYMASGYLATLQAMPEPLRSQMLFGDFKAGRKTDPWQVIPTEWVKLAQDRWRERPKPDLPQTAIGVDVARGGDDQTVLAPRYGNWIGPLETHPGSETPNGPVVAAFIRLMLQGDAVVNLDVIGVGGAVLDALGGVTVNPVNFGAASAATDRTHRFGFANIRAEAWWRMREALDPLTGDDLALPPDSQLLADLCAPRWKPVARGIQVESKEDISRRIKRSPDRGDAVVLSLCPHYSPNGGIFV